MRDAIRSVWAEPEAPDPPGPLGRDWVLVGVLAVVALLEGALRPDVVWRPLVTVLAIAVLFALPWRRTHPLPVLLIGFGSAVVLDVAAVVTGEHDVGLYTMVVLLLLAYALTRWASGRDRAIGVAFLILPLTLGLYASWTGLGDAIGGTAVLLAALAIGAAVRSRTAVRSREVEQIKLLEREQLARELHDTVAHHVSAIIIQAQAGRTLAPTQPAAAVAALEVIETAATETLADMRAMVRILRTGDAAELQPLGGIADIPRLAARAGDDPPVAVELSGTLDDLPPSVDAAAYRLVQESITNALRHAHRATQVLVHVGAEPDGVLHIRVHDDGDTTHVAAVRPGGYGLVGMAERARLLGGTCAAGPDPAGGWTVEAALPATAPDGSLVP